MINKYTNILWDFDGVIIDSEKIREEGFYKIFECFPVDQVEQLMDFHRNNGGLSRYVKIKYFYEKIIKKDISEADIIKIANDFSNIMLSKLINPALLIEDSLCFIKSNYKFYNMHIVSASDQTELRHICSKLNIEKHFKSIHGSPETKINSVKNLIERNKYVKSECVLIGDSFNDKEAADTNNISFIGYNNTKLMKESNYINSFINYK